MRVGPRPRPAEPVDERVVRELAEWARAEGLQMTGTGGLLGRLTKRVFESALEGELDADIGYGKHGPARRDAGNSRNGKRPKMVLTEVGLVELEVLRDWGRHLHPAAGRQSESAACLVDDVVLSLSAAGFTHGEISAHLAEVYGRRCPSRPSARSRIG